MTSHSRSSRRAFVSALAAAPALLWPRRASALVPALVPDDKSSRQIRTISIDRFDSGEPPKESPSEETMIFLHPAHDPWVKPGDVARVSGIASVALRVSMLWLGSDLGMPSDWLVSGLWVGGRCVPGTEDLPGERCNEVTSPPFPDYDVEAGDEIEVAAEYVGFGKNGLLNGAILSCWRPPVSEEELKLMKYGANQDIANALRAHRARCVEDAMRMSDEEAMTRGEPYRRWRDLARAGLVG